MKIILTIFFMLCVINSNTTGKILNHETLCLIELNNFIKTQWNFLSDKGYYKLGKGFMNAVYKNQFTCIRGMDTSFVRKTFGSKKLKITTDFPYGFKDSICAAFEYPLSLTIDEYQAKGYKSFDETTLRVYFNYKREVTRITLNVISLDSQN